MQILYMTELIFCQCNRRLKLELIIFIFRFNPHRTAITLPARIGAFPSANLSITIEGAFSARWRTATTRPISSAALWTDAVSPSGITRPHGTATTTAELMKMAMMTTTPTSTPNNKTSILKWRRREGNSRLAQMHDGQGDVHLAFAANAHGVTVWGLPTKADLM